MQIRALGAGLSRPTSRPPNPASPSWSRSPRWSGSAWPSPSAGSPATESGAVGTWRSSSSARSSAPRLSASGANALNQWAERDRDGLMPRTAKRPLPSGTLLPSRVFAVASALVVLGLGVLWLTSGLAAMCVSAACVGVYLFLYTPLKTQTWTATLVGAIPGALPPLIGWCAGYREFGFGAAVAPGGVALFMLMFVWQLPHFLAIAWMYREDYARGGHAVLPVVDKSGVKTSIVIAVFTVLLIPATISPVIAMPRVLGPLSLFTAAVSGLLFAGLVARLLKTRTREHARAVFFASIIHLPLLLVVMVLDAFVRTFF
ncbi:MAG: UbiA family prenyltransferase [Planctomycetota bacterium]|nr:MAG: UbiA family prenyltransferase [Planctomycetota bacterium]